MGHCMALPTHKSVWKTDAVLINSNESNLTAFQLVILSLLKHKIRTHLSPVTHIIVVRTWSLAFHSCNLTWI